MRPCEIFLEAREELLGDHGYEPDPGRVEQTARGLAFYHYTRPERLDEILAPDGGLWARLPIACPDPPEEFVGYHKLGGFLEPLPTWLVASPYFGDLGLELTKQYVGDLLLRIEVPRDLPGLFVADFAHDMECKHLTRRGTAPLGLGYDCATGHEVTQAYVHSYVPATEYQGGHVAPIMEAVRKGEGIVIPQHYISVAHQQPLAQ